MTNRLPRKMKKRALKQMFKVHPKGNSYTRFWALMFLRVCANNGVNPITVLKLKL